jgi:DNA polymerase III delta subunit
VTLEELQEALGVGTLERGYLLAGPEPLLRDDALAAVRAAVLEGGPEDFNFDRLDGASTRPTALLDAVRTLPVMATRRLVALRDPDAGRGSKLLLEALPDALAECDASHGSVLVVMVTKADARSKWVAPAGRIRARRCRIAGGTHRTAADDAASGDRENRVACGRGHGGHPRARGGGRARHCGGCGLGSH